MKPRARLKPGKERPVLSRHPWIFSGALDRVDPVEDGGIVEVVDATGRPIAQGYYNSRSQIAIRVMALEDRPVDRELLSARLERARAARERLGLTFNREGAPTSAFRLINAEADGLPGLVVDAYGAFLVVQLLTAGMDRLRAELTSLLDEALRPSGIYERSDVEVRQKEGLEPRTGVLAGAEPPPRLEVAENGLRLTADLLRGHKTGFYLDQRDNRRRLAELAAARQAAQPGLEVLNAFAYSGAFGVYLCSARPDARVLNLDASADALDLARENYARAGLADRAEHQIGDAFHELRRFRDAGRSFDLVILDPPKFAHSRGQVTAACRGYKDLNLLALKLLRPSGLLATFSCSGLVSPELFQKVVFDAASDASRSARILAKLGPGPDHASLLSFPEGEYLKGLIIELGD